MGWDSSKLSFPRGQDYAFLVAVSLKDGLGEDANMDGKRDWVRSVMLPVIGWMGLAGAVVGGLFGWLVSDDKTGLTPTSGAICCAVAFATPTWAVLWLIWAVRRPRE
jgi:hypothetical protein